MDRFIVAQSEQSRCDSVHLKSNIDRFIEAVRLKA